MRFSLLALAALIAVQEPAKVAIAWTPNKGEKFRCEVSLTQSGTMGTVVSMTVLTFDLGLEVGEVGKDGQVDVKATYERIRFTMSSHSNKDFALDSDRGEDPAMEPDKRVMLHLKGKAITLKVGPKGLSQVQGLADAFREAYKSVGEGDDKVPGKSEPIAIWLEQAMRITFPDAPDSAVAAGEGWSRSLSFERMSLRGATIKDLAKVKTIEKGRAAIDHKLTVELAAEREPGIAEVTGEGSTLWNLERGMPESHEIVIKVRGREIDQKRSEEHRFTLKLEPRKKR